MNWKFWKKKEKVLYWDWEREDGDKLYDVSEFIKPAKSKESGCPIHKMPTYLSGARNAFEDMIKQHEAEYKEESHTNGSSTLRICPGVSSLFKRSFVLFSPVDWVISFDSKRSFKVTMPPNITRLHPFNVNMHPIEQTQIGSENLLDGKIAIKISFPIFLKSHYSFFYQEAFWHNKNAFRVVPGIVDSNEFQRGPVTFFLHFDLPKSGLKHITIKKGDALAYLTSDVPLKLKQRKEINVPLRKTFIRGFS